jgi:chromosomal replication initiator protein
MQDNGLWQAVLGEIELSVSHGNYVTWFQKTRLLRRKGDTLVVGVPNVFVKQQLERKFNQLITDTLHKNGVQPERIEYKIHAALPKTNQLDSAVRMPSRGHNIVNKPRRQTAGSLTHAYRQGLNERYNFDNFIVGSGNELAYAACQAVAQNPGTKYNPLFLYGGVGIGKTHLLQAVGNAVLARKPQSHIVYVSSEQFVQEFLDAIRYKKNTDFAGFYRGADVLIIDDMQFIAGKEKTQDEFFHTFNALHQANKQIIISSDKPPKEIPTLEARLRSRFEWGMSIDMQTPDLETRCAIVQTKAMVHGTTLTQDVVEFLASHFQTNIRELEGALNQFLAYCELHGAEPDINVVKGLLSSGKSRPKHLSARVIIERTAKHFQLPMEDMLGPKRDRDIVIPRQIAMYMLRSELHLSFPKIARELGRKDHTTAIHSVEKISRESALDADVRTAISEIKERLYA